MKKQMKDLITQYDKGGFTYEELEWELLNLFSVTNSTLRKCCNNPDVKEMESQNTDCDGDNETCTITYCKNCKQTLRIEP